MRLPSPSKLRHPGQMKPHWAPGHSTAAREQGCSLTGPTSSQLPTVQEWGCSPDHCGTVSGTLSPSVPAPAPLPPIFPSSSHWLCIPSASNTLDPVHPQPLAALPHPGSTAPRLLNLWQHQQQPCQRHYNKGSLKSPKLFPILWPLSLCEQREK